MFQLNNTALKNSETIFVQSEGVKKELQSCFQINNKIRVLPNSVNVIAFMNSLDHAQKNSDIILKKYGITDEKILLFLGTAN